MNNHANFKVHFLQPLSVVQTNPRAAKRQICGKILLSGKK
jgi:hypothetical protein